MQNKIVTKEEWVEARKQFLIKEKEFNKLRDELTKKRQQLPWTKVDKEYIFETDKGQQNFADLFAGKTQLIVYHFMFGPSWKQGCKNCSFVADHYEKSIIHLQQQDISFVTISRAPLQILGDFKKRMGWSFKWVSSLGNDFNFDYDVSFTKEDMKNQVYYNYQKTTFPAEEGPGVSVFYKNTDGNIYHTYSSYSRGLDLLIGAYNYLDIVPKGRNEEGPMSWVRHHDRYKE
ncbi:DUF899 domain-containing protein [Candidatus Uabimicrobium sp. HlEnr_7]|uniref:DUF899 domain-containing protein n=1 Tax=Candidatus Uabimicrobium helgolandensis TaxID=3095367 RepID=UPI0035584E86